MLNFNNLQQFSNNELKEIFDNGKSKSDIGRKLGFEISTMNGNTFNDILSFYANKIGYDINDFTIQKIKYNTYIQKNPVCKQCGTSLTYKQYKYKQLFCSDSCAAIYNNAKRGEHSIETKNKIANTLKNKKLYNSNYILNTELIKEGKLSNTKGIQYKELYLSVNNPNLHKVCCICKKEFIPEILSSGKVSYSKVCSDECRYKLRHNIGVENTNKLKEQGHIFKWQSRNITSYPEKFWINVLDNNNITYIREYSVQRENTQNYFLDFYIEHNGYKIDLEIDGRQHKDRKEHDTIRDEYMSSLGYLVYRVEWNSINTDFGKRKMKEKIDNFINWFNNL